jgi:enamine deaminase RidA (YjgF/YER057c/UK114 family)
MASLVTPKRECQVCSRSEGGCNGETVQVVTSRSREVFIRCAPCGGPSSVREQVEKFYTCLPNLLDAVDAKMSNVVLERVFFRDIVADFDTFNEVRRDAYDQAGVTGDELPAASYIKQAPCRPDQAVELQVQAILPNGDSNVKVHSFPITPQGAARKLVEIGEYRHLYITNINGSDDTGKMPSDFRTQSDNMFEQSAKMLTDFDTTWPDVLRTWCYLHDIDRDYDAFNASRNEFFKQHGVERLPASTGIQASLYPDGTLCGFDLYSLLNPEGAQIEVMHTPTLNEADEYGSAFSRGMKVVLPEKTVLYISGTASVDEYGATVHLDDVRKQIERMLLNVRELMKPHGATAADMVQVITYLKSASYLSTFQEIWKDWGMMGLPNTFVEAGVCRPELLCEMEAIVMVPS